MRNKLYMVLAQYPEDPNPLPIEFFLSKRQADAYIEYLDNLWNIAEEDLTEIKPTFSVSAHKLRNNAAEAIIEDEMKAWGSGEYT